MPKGIKGKKGKGLSKENRTRVPEPPAQAKTMAEPGASQQPSLDLTEEQLAKVTQQLMLQIVESLSLAPATDCIKILCVSSSIVKRAADFARTMPGGTKLGLKQAGISIWWQGYSGLKFMALQKKIITLLKYEHPPDFLFIHCGANDIGQTLLQELLQCVDPLIEFVEKKLPGTKLIWSQMLPHLSWRYSENDAAMDRSRGRFNRTVAKKVLKSGRCYVKYPEILKKPKHLFEKDGVHLSPTGNAILVNTIEEAVCTFKWSESPVYP
ncbi:uncharacterized protein LOC121383593 [Gigantopelta aegis]|uniref:uncharacterized protein LOC121383593 n=1 Tax=Gigantopelta aegis TaxID=1735272 RepID=UPI001B88D264|nr:uncharacterized protein LOC121383593 [Gigantopelta aegis]